MAADYSNYIPLLMIISQTIDIVIFLLRIFKILLQVRILFYQLILFNPYQGPLLILNNLTEWYFRFWRKLLKPVFIGIIRVDLGTLLSFQVIPLIIVLLEDKNEYILSTIEYNLKNLK